MIVMTRDEMYEMHGLLHQLWSKSGTVAYDKKEWIKFEELIAKSINMMLGPEAEQVGYLRLIMPRRWADGGDRCNVCLKEKAVWSGHCKGCYPKKIEDALK